MNKTERILSSLPGTENSVPTFLLKLLDLLQEPVFQKYVSWNDEGNSFIVHDQASFSKLVLPKYFKHNKFASFVRQLNMYGFRKVTTILQNNLQTQMEEIEFHHPYFIRGDESLLPHIKRKVTQASKIASEDINQVLDEVHDIKGAQHGITTSLNDLRRENESLWQEVVSLRQKHSHQQKVVNRLIQFLVGLVQHHGMGMKRKLPMIESGDAINSSVVNNYPAKKARKDVTVNNVIDNIGSPSGTMYVPGDSNLNVSNNDDGPLITELLSNPMSNNSNNDGNDTNFSTSGGMVLDHNDNTDFDISNLIQSPKTPNKNVNNPVVLQKQNPMPVNTNLPAATDNTLSDDRTLEELLNTIEQPEQPSSNTTDLNIPTSQNNQQLALVAPSSSTNPGLVLNNDVDPDYLNNSLDKINTNLNTIKRRLSNNEQVQLDYDIIQELFNNSVDITPRQNLMDSTLPYPSGIGQELVQYNGGDAFDNEGISGDKSENLNDILNMLE